jgi:hypothetical protein
MRQSFPLVVLLSLVGTAASAAELPVVVPRPSAVTAAAELVPPAVAHASPALAERSEPVAEVTYTQTFGAPIAAAQVVRDVPTLRVVPATDHASTFRGLTTTYVALTVLDSVTTTVALRRGLVEKNPLLGSFASNAPALFATKAAMAVGTVLVARQLWKTHPMARVAVMVAVNVATGMVVASNARLIQATH